MLRLEWFTQDVVGFLLAFALTPLALVLPGAALARLAQGRGPKLSWSLSLLAGFALLPPVLDLAGRAGPRAMLAADAALALAGAVLLARRGEWRASGGWRWPAILFGGVALLAFLCALPIPAGGDIWLNLLNVDHVKHAAVVDMIAQTGSPPRNLLAAPETPPLRYYYFFYLAPAVVDMAGGGWIAARHAVFAVIPFLMLALYALAAEIAERLAPAIDEASRARRAKLIASLLLVSGFGTLLAAIGFAVDGDHLDLFLAGALWVPQHNASALAGLFALVLLARADATAAGGDRRQTWRWLAAAAFAFATCAASSVYVGIGVALSCALWLAVVAARRDWARAGRIAVAGTAAAILLAPFVLLLAAGQGAQTGAPLALGLRAPDYAPIAAAHWPAPARTIIFYASGLGVLLLGALLYWREGAKEARRGLGLALAIMAATCLLLGTFVRSTIISNDFGWRVLIPTQFVLLIFCVFAMERAARWRGPLRGALVLGRADLAAALVTLFLVTPERTAEIHGPDSTMAAGAQRDMWDEIAGLTEPDAIVQTRPRQLPHAAEALYRQRPAAMTDVVHGLVFGGGAELDARRRDLDRLFADPALPSAEAREIAQRYALAYVVLQPGDPVWPAAAWMERAALVRATPTFRLYRTRP